MHEPTPNDTEIPESETPAEFARRIKSNVRNILLASPDFPRLYADVVISSAPNSLLGKTLAHHYKKICGMTTAEFLGTSQTTITNSTDLDRTQMSTDKSCTHVKVTGVRCGSPALRGEQFCYFHQRMIRTVKGPDSRIHHVALLENDEAIQASLMEVVNALIRGTIDLKRGELILRALNIAVRNIRRVRFENQTQMITQIPDYNEPKPAHAETSAPATEAHGAADAFVRPGGPAVSVRGAVKPAAISTLPQANEAAATQARESADPFARPAPQAQPTMTPKVDPTRPKPPVSVKTAQVLPSRKHRARSR
jgi:hypothetical protein